MGLGELQTMMRRVSELHELHRTLEARGHTIEEIKTVGSVQLIRRTDDGYQAASDPRKGGAPAGQ